MSVMVDVELLLGHDIIWEIKMIDMSKSYLVSGRLLEVLERMAEKLRTGDVDSDELVDMGEALELLLNDLRPVVVI